MDNCTFRASRGHGGGSSSKPDPGNASGSILLTHIQLHRALLHPGSCPTGPKEPENRRGLPDTLHVPGSKQEAVVPPMAPMAVGRPGPSGVGRLQTLPSHSGALP